MSIIYFFSVATGFQRYSIHSDCLSDSLTSAAVGNNDGFYFNVSVGERIDYVICLSQNQLQGRWLVTDIRRFKGTFLFLKNVEDGKMQVVRCNDNFPENVIFLSSPFKPKQAEPKQVVIPSEILRFIRIGD